MYQGTFCIESTAPWMATKPPPSRMYCWKLANSIAVSACAPRPTVESKITVLYSRSVSMCRNGLSGSDTSIGAWRPGVAPMSGSQTSTSKPFSAPSSWTSASTSTIDW